MPQDIIARGSSALNIRQFAAEVRRSGVQHVNRYTVMITLPAGVEGSSRQLKLRCFATELPGKSFMTKEDILRYGRGPVDSVPYGVQYGPIPLSFILDDRSDVLETFHKWHSLIVDADSVDGMSGKYEVAYKDDYAVSIQIQQEDVTGQRTFTCELFKAYPLSIGSISVSWDQANQISILPVTFAYRDYKNTKLPSSGSSLLDDLQRASSKIPKLIGTFKRIKSIF